MFDWYLIHTKPRSEDLVSKQFTDSGLEVLNAKLKERKFYRRKLQDIVSPCFSNYVFVRFDNPKDYRLVKYTWGVRSIIGIDGAPTVVPQEIIDRLRARMEEGFIRLLRRDFNIGERVLIKDGPFQGIEAVFEREMSGNERVAILLGTINARVVVDRAMLAKYE